jgi:hypothetical protein
MKCFVVRAFLGITHSETKYNLNRRPIHDWARAGVGWAGMHRLCYRSLSGGPAVASTTAVRGRLIRLSYYDIHSKEIVAMVRYHMVFETKGGCVASRQALLLNRFRDQKETNKGGLGGFPILAALLNSIRLAHPFIARHRIFAIAKPKAPNFTEMLLSQVTTNSKYKALVGGCDL